MPFSIAAASTNVLKVEPAWRVDCATRLNWLPFVLTTAVIARIAPVPGSTETIAAAGSVLYGQDVVDRLLGQVLQPRIDRRVDLQAALAHRVGAVLLLELVDHVREEVRLR